MSTTTKSQRRGPIVVVLSALAIATVAVVGLVPAGAQNPGCEGLERAYNQVTNPNAQQVILNQLAAHGCAVPSSTSSSSSSSSTSSSSTSSSSTSSSSSSSSSSTSSSSTSITTGGGGVCAGLRQALSNVSNPTARQVLLSALTRAGCGGTV